MKKLLLTVLIICGFTFSAKAQLSVGGGLGLGSDSQNRFYINIAPEIGYGISNHFTVGGRLSYQSRSNLFGVDPFVRLNILNPDSLIRLMATIHAPMKFASEYFSYGCYFQPGVSVRVGDNVRMEFHVGAFGWGKVKSGDYSQSGWDAKVNSNTISVGVVFGL